MSDLREGMKELPLSLLGNDFRITTSVQFLDDDGNPVLCHPARFRSIEHVKAWIQNNKKIPDGSKVTMWAFKLYEVEEQFEYGPRTMYHFYYGRRVHRCDAANRTKA